VLHPLRQCSVVLSPDRQTFLKSLFLIQGNRSMYLYHAVVLNLHGGWKNWIIFRWSWRKIDSTKNNPKSTRYCQVKFSIISVAVKICAN